MPDTTPPDLPIACTLDAHEYARRTAALAVLAARALCSREPTATGERFRFADTPETERELRAAIAAEARCCAFLTMDLQRRDGGLVLEVDGPRDARPVIAALFG